MQSTHVNELDMPPIAAFIYSAEHAGATVPDTLTTAYAELQQHLDTTADALGRLADSGSVKEAQRLQRQAAAHFVPDQLITDCLRPALDAFLADFTADRKAAGRWANEVAVSTPMLTEPQQMREAIVRLHAHLPRWGFLRGAWKTLYEHGSGIDVIDPLGARSPLTEIRNLPEVFEGWEAAHVGRKPWPWPSNAFHVRLGWLLDHGAEVWLPTRLQHRETYLKYNPQIVLRGVA